MNRTNLPKFLETSIRNGLKKETRLRFCCRPEEPSLSRPLSVRPSPTPSGPGVLCHSLTPPPSESCRLSEDEPDRCQLPHGLALRRRPACRCDRGDAIREVQPGRASALHQSVQGHDHQEVAGLRLCQLPAARRR